MQRREMGHDMELGAITWETIGLGGTWAMIGISVLRGWFVPRRYLLDLRLDHKEQTAGKDKEIETWTGAFQMERATNGELTKGYQEMVRVVETVANALEAVPRGAEIARSRRENRQ